MEIVEEMRLGLMDSYDESMIMDEQTRRDETTFFVVVEIILKFWKDGLLKDV